jgi:hypothetical protein
MQLPDYITDYQILGTPLQFTRHVRRQLAGMLRRRNGALENIPLSQVFPCSRCRCETDLHSMECFAASLRRKTGLIKYRHLFNRYADPSFVSSKGVAPLHLETMVAIMQQAKTYAEFSQGIQKDIKELSQNYEIEFVSHCAPFTGKQFITRRYSPMIHLLVKMPDAVFRSSPSKGLLLYIRSMCIQMIPLEPYFVGLVPELQQRGMQELSRGHYGDHRRSLSTWSTANRSRELSVKIDMDISLSLLDNISRAKHHVTSAAAAPVGPQCHNCARELAEGSYSFSIPDMAQKCSPECGA